MYDLGEEKMKKLETLFIYKHYKSTLQKIPVLMLYQKSLISLFYYYNLQSSQILL